MNFEYSLIKAINLLASVSHDFIMLDMDTFLGSVFQASEYERTDEDQVNIAKVERIHAIRSEIEKIQHTATAEHPGTNSFTISSGNYRQVFRAIQNRSMAVSELEEIADDALLLDSFSESARRSIIGAYRSCRESYLTVQSMINIYNEHNPSRLPSLRIPKDVPLPE
jgi:hypothetical protein